MIKAQEAPVREPARLASLADLREEIDRIDRELHAGLIARGEIVDRLIAVKAREGGGSAFRPAREAEMMRRLVSRHRGILPLDTVEGIWRIIISTFTYVQAPYTVHADNSGGDAPMRDSARFHFGFTVPLAVHEGARAVIAAVAAGPGDLGLIRATDRLRVDDTSTAWWADLAPPDAPKIIARLPFVERADHAAGLPLYVVAKPVREAAVPDVQLFAVDLAIPLEGSGVPRAKAPVEIVAWRTTDTGLTLVVTAPDGMSPTDVAAVFFAHVANIAAIGSHAARFEAPKTQVIPA